MFTIRQILRLYASGRAAKILVNHRVLRVIPLRSICINKYVLSEKTMVQIDAMTDAQMAGLFLGEDRLTTINNRAIALEPLLLVLGSSR